MIFSIRKPARPSASAGLPEASERDAPAKPAFNEIVEEMAEAFRTGKILSEDLGPSKICTLVVSYLGKRLEAMWYPHNRWTKPPERNYRLVWVKFNDQTHLGTDDEAEYIKEAARWRANHRLQEMAQALLEERAAFKAQARSADEGTASGKAEPGSPANGDK